MTWAATELQKTLFSVLTGDATLMGKISAVYDSGAVPDSAAFPYVTIGEAPMNNRSNHTWRGWQADVTIHVWYQDPARGRAKVQEIQSEIDRLLNTRDICIDGWNIVSLRLQFVDVIIDEDNVTLHGVQIFNLLLGEA